MPDGAAAPAGAAAEPQQRRGGNFVGGLIRMGVTWYLMKNLMGGGQKGPAGANRDDQVWPAFNKSHTFDLFMFLHEYPALPPSKWADDEAVWVVRDVPLAGPGIDLSHNLTYRPSQDVQRNGTLYAHAIFVAEGGALNPSAPEYDASKIIHRVCAGAHAHQPREVIGCAAATLQPCQVCAVAACTHRCTRSLRFFPHPETPRASTCWPP